MSELFPPAAPDFGDPLGLLAACHTRIEQFCDQLALYASQPAEAAEHSLAQQAHRYFSTAGVHHHQDEEQDIFPRLARQNLKLADLVHSFKQEHQQIEALWAELGPMLQRPNTIADRDAFNKLCLEYVELQRRHVRRENSDLLSVAQHIFSGKELKSLGKSMAERRGVQVRL